MLRESPRLEAASVAPRREALLGALGIPAEHPAGERTRELAERALRVLERCAEPRGIFQEIGVSEFGAVYAGEGRNASSSPLAEIYPRAERLALFVVTLGATVDAEIRALFDERDFALASLADAAASEAAERAAVELEARVAERFRQEDAVGAECAAAANRALRYSPGYCGWHVTGQRALFGALRPREIGVTLGESCLMQPMKSVSGVVVWGPPAIHRFENVYSFCPECRPRSCRLRVRALEEAG